MCWGMGGFLSSGTLRGSLSIEGDWAWRMPFLLQWVWPVPLFLVAWFAPESESSLWFIASPLLTRAGPYYLVRKERDAEAAAVLKRIAKPGYRTDRMIEAQMTIIKQANEIEKMYAASASYLDCFRGTNLKRTEIGVMCWITQVFNGAPMTGYTTLL